jgi:predicted RNase H-like nuclease
VHFVGVDLARDDRRTSGLAVLDASGRLVHVESVHTDAEVVDALKPFTTRECLVAVNAPLVVRNATGNRPAEAALNKDFARFDAGAHPSNTSKPELTGTPRGAAVVAALGLDLNPRSRRARRAVEVNPKPATVALFRLGRTLKYKNKPGRTLESLRAALGALMGHLESLADATPPLDLTAPSWADLVDAVAAARRKADLRVVEDQVDAVLCAYVALFAARRRDDVTTYGDLDTGYIVTPTLPADLVPQARGARAVANSGTVPDADGADAAAGAVDEGPVLAAVREYSARQPEIAAAGAAWVALVTAVLDEAGINYLNITGRVKSVESFAEKAGREVDGVPLYADPLAEITDQIGVRVITYVLGDVATVAGLLAEQIAVRDDRDMGRETAS